MNEYYFSGIRFIPGYNDTDWDDAHINAVNEIEAWKKLFQLTKRFTWRYVSLSKINGVDIEPQGVPENV